MTPAVTLLHSLASYVNYNLRCAPCNHLIFNSNAVHGGLNQRFPIAHSAIILLLYFSYLMSGLTPNSPRPTDIRLHQASRKLEIAFDDDVSCMLPCEFLRVYSPSAEVRGHGKGQEVLQLGKETVNITNIEPVGNYAVKLTFSDGHDTGLYSWD